MSGATIKVPVRMNKLKAHRVEWRRGSRPMETLRSEIDRLLDDFLRGYWHIPFKRSAIDVEPYWRGDVTLGTTLAVDIVERDDGRKLTVELPGLDPHDVAIRFAAGTLTIEEDKQATDEDEKLDHFLSERRYGDFHRSFRVPNGVDTEKIEASLKNGVLTVVPSKTAETRKQETRIAVRAN
jgi:HSP20 family protein